MPLTVTLVLLATTTGVGVTSWAVTVNALEQTPAVTDAGPERSSETAADTVDDDVVIPLDSFNVPISVGEHADKNSADDTAITGVARKAVRKVVRKVVSDETSSEADVR